MKNNVGVSLNLWFTKWNTLIKNLMKLQHYFSIFLLSVHSNFIRRIRQILFSFKINDEQIGNERKRTSASRRKRFVFFSISLFLLPFPMSNYLFFLCFYLFFSLLFFKASDLFDWLYNHELFFDNIPPLIILITLHYITLITFVVNYLRIDRFWIVLRYLNFWNVIFFLFFNI